MDGCVGDAPRKGKARVAKASAARLDDDEAAVAPHRGAPPPPARDPTACFGAGTLTALAGSVATTLPLAIAAPHVCEAKGALVAAACVVVDVWGRPPPAWLAGALPPETLAALRWARAAGPAAAAALVEALLARSQSWRLVLCSLDEIWALPRWPRRASGMLALAHAARVHAASVVALCACPWGGARCAPLARLPAALDQARLAPLDAAHEAQLTRRGERGREFLAWASLRAQTCQCGPSALPLAPRSAQDRYLKSNQGAG